MTDKHKHSLHVNCTRCGKIVPWHETYLTKKNQVICYQCHDQKNGHHKAGQVRK